MRSTETLRKEKLALLGGAKAISLEQGNMFTWPIVTKEHEDAVLEVLRAGTMSGTDVTKQFEAEYAAEMGMKYALACNNGTAAIHCAFYGMGIGVGDEVICPSMTYWASALPLYSLGATPVFADIEPATLCIDPGDIEHRITPRTKAIVVVHYAGMPADMDPIMAIAAKHGLKVFEDGSHAHGALYKGQPVGTFGEASGFSLMSGKSLAVGEAGILFTNNRTVYERGLLFGHYARHGEIEDENLKRWAGLPCGGYKYRMHQVSAAFGRVQLRRYPEQMAEIDRAMNTFADLLEKTPGIETTRPAKGSNSTRGGWYAPHFRYRRAELGGLSIHTFAKAVQAEGSMCTPGSNKPLHLHPLFTEMDVYGHGKPTRRAHLQDPSAVDQPSGSLPVSERIANEVFCIPWFKHFRPEIIEQHAEAFIKAALRHEELLSVDTDPAPDAGVYSTFRRV